MNFNNNAIVLSAVLLATPNVYASAMIAGIDLNQSLDINSPSVLKSSQSHYEPQMSMYEITNTSDFTYKVDSAYVFTTPLSNVVMFIETRTKIEEGTCDSYKRSFKNYITEKLSNDNTIPYNTKSDGEGVVDKKLKNTYSSECFNAKVDEKGFKYSAEFIGNFTSSTSWGIYTNEKDQLITSK